MRKLFLICVMLPLLLALGACSSGVGSSSIQTVQAQSGYSNSSLDGTYAVQWWDFYTTMASPYYYNALGTIQLNGAGNITGGTITEYNPSVPPFPCVYSVAGTYNIQSTALGVATLNLSSSTKGCLATDTWQVALAAADGGTAVQMARTDQIATGSAVKQ